MQILNVPTVLSSCDFEEYHVILNRNFRTSSCHDQLSLFSVCMPVLFGGTPVMCWVNLCRSPKIVPDIKRTFDPRGE